MSFICEVCLYFKTALATAGGGHQRAISLNATFADDEIFSCLNIEAHNLVDAQSLVPSKRPGDFLYQCIFAS